MPSIGYEFLHESLTLTAFPPIRPARIMPVTRIALANGVLAVPKHVAPQNLDPLSHVLFALKHEGCNLQILAEALPKIDATSMLAELNAAPTGGYIRVACFLWEHFNGKELSDIPAIGGPFMPVFNPEWYLTGSTRRDKRWRVDFNGLGSLHYCATVEQTPYLRKAIKSDILGRAKTFMETLDQKELDRALTWAYLHETEDSFAIERESPTEDKARAFVALLQQAHDQQALTEDYLVGLQNAAITNPYDKAASYRTEQNWLRGPLNGALGVTYLPPPPAMVPMLMQELAEFTRWAPKAIDPVVAAAIACFGFVFIHPFMDGNGRLSRFLFHYVLCQSGRLDKGLLLPVSIAMKRHEEDYLATLQTYSKPARQRWRVLWIDDGNYANKFVGTEAMYRYWDATPCAEFGYRMAEQALEIELRKETIFLAQYDAIYRAVNDRFDVRGDTLVILIRGCLEQNGVVSKNRRKQFAGQVSVDVFDLIETMAQHLLETAPEARTEDP